MSKRQDLDRKLENVHPGDILYHEFMVPYDLTVIQLGKDLKVSPSLIADMLLKQRDVTADMALRLSRYFGTTAEFWLNLQQSYDLEKTRELRGKRIKGEVPLKYRTGHGVKEDE